MSTFSFKYTGDEEIARSLMRFAMKQAGILKEHCAVNNLLTSRRLLKDKSGQIIEIIKSNDHFHCVIYVPKVTAAKVIKEIEIPSRLSNIMLAGERFYGYNYITDALTAFGETNQKTDLTPGYNGVSNVLPYLSISSTGNVIVWETDISDVSYLFGINAYELTVFSDGVNIYGLHGTDLGRIGTIQAPDILLPELCNMQGSLGGLTVYKSSDAWNLYRGVILYTLNPVNQILLDSWYWVPSFFTAQPADAFGLPPGFYYGKYPYSNYGIETALESLKVSFRTLINTRYTSETGAYQYGWIEQVTEVNGEAVSDLHIYLQQTPLTVPGHSNFGYLRIAGTTADQFITVGSDLPGFEAALVLTVNGTPEVDLWNFKIWTNPDALLPTQDSGVGIAVIDGPNATFRRFTGATATVLETAIYHSHSVSQDGTVLAVFESEDGVLISGVRVFDLFGVRTDVKKAEYSSGGFTELRISFVVAATSAVAGCLIPYRTEDFEPLTLPYDLATSAPVVPDITDYILPFSSLSMMYFPKNAESAPRFTKVICTNGVDAELIVSDDECFDSTITIEPIGEGITEEKLVGSWDAGGILNGVVRGDYSQNGSTIRFIGVDTDGAETVTKGDMTLEEDIFGDVTQQGGLGSITIIGPEDTPDQDCDEQIYTKYSAVSSCGQMAILEETVPGIVASPEITEPASGDLVDVGTNIHITGGKPPYSVVAYNMTVTKIDENNWEIATVPTCIGDESATATITVTDDCGRQDVAEVRLDITYARWCCDNPNSPPLYCTTSVGSIRWNCTSDDTPSVIGDACLDGGSSVNVDGYANLIGAVYFIENINCKKNNANLIACTAPADGGNPCYPLAGDCQAGGIAKSCVQHRWYGYWRCPL